MPTIQQGKRTQNFIMVDLIEKKKAGLEHSKEEIQYLIASYVDGKIPDYQMAAWLMAVNFQGMTDAETIALVEEMLLSGTTLDLSHIKHFKVDKHSTGGVGDKASLILAPLAVAAGCVVPMISGRGLGHTGGTLDKLESIPGFNANLSSQEFVQLVEKNGLAMGGQTEELVPADRKIYALRDVTATVNSIPLICGSILSKKIAEGIDGLVLDVKTGNGAFLPDYNQSQQLAKQLKRVGEHFGLRIKAVITDMNQPLGRAVGNWLEVVESVETLKGYGPEDLTELTLELTAWMVVLSGIEKNFNKARELLKELITSGEAYQKFLTMVEAQGGDTSYIEHPEKYKPAAYQAPVLATESGWVKSIDTKRIGMCAVTLGAGRLSLNSVIRPEVGLTINKKIGDYVEVGESLVTVHASSRKSFEEVQSALHKAYHFSKTPVTPPPLFYETF
ncbi:MAG TPA: thymidine phosphorylase [Candidatus Marinimicrobia bacterium]|nr:thymidine phosphorylase [Candidatus Neomarinimicrobiota bacterium]HRS52475.1 thymidine phosphorylase [Candidatus Neomarinimicrobiota bacterium]HRU92426.1 thymidine phosphorylase [Candidatus Neomarinimicrobiota bacterium]